MTIIDNYLVFNNLPENAPITVYLTDDKGNIAEKQNLTTNRNSLQMKNLKKGTYFVTLESNTSGKRKSFMLSLQ